MFSGITSNHVRICLIDISSRTEPILSCFHIDYRMAGLWHERLVHKNNQSEAGNLTLEIR